MGSRSYNQYRRLPRLSGSAAPHFALPAPAVLSASRRWPRLVPQRPGMWREVAGWERLSPRVLRLLSRHPEPIVRTATAVHLHTSPSVLGQLARDPDDQVRWCVAGNPHTPPASLEVLGSDPQATVRAILAFNPAVPVDVLCQLLQDTDRWAVRAAADNPSLPPAVRAMWQLAQGDDQ